MAGKGRWVASRDERSPARAILGMPAASELDLEFPTDVFRPIQFNEIMQFGSNSREMNAVSDATPARNHRTVAALRFAK